MANRFDRIDAPSWMYSKFKKTPEGYLQGRAVVCTTGVYEYRRADGTVQKELRLPEEVFAPAFLDSLKLKPLTLYHPTEMVDAQNVKQYQVGIIGGNPSSRSGGEDVPSASGTPTGYQFYSTDDYHVAIDIVIHDAAAVSAVEDGVRELSVGYSCNLEPAEPGARWCGMEYDFIQRDIRANHVSLVDKARAGDSARIHLDAADAELVCDEGHSDIGGDKMPDNLKVIKIDGVEYSAEPKVLEALHVATTKADTLQTSLDAMTAEKTKVEAERDSMKDRVDSLDAKVKELETKKLDEAVIATAVARRVKILDAARGAGVEVKDGMSELDIQKAVILKVFPKATLDGKDAVYIDARFDGAVESIAVTAETNADAATREAGGGVEQISKGDAAPVDAHAEYVKRLRDAYKGEKK